MRGDIPFLSDATGSDASLFEIDASAGFNVLKRNVSLIEIVPDEILTLILEYACLCHDESIHFSRDGLSRVSRRWRQIILHTPSFWSILYLSPWSLPHDLSFFLENYLERSKQYPLDIHLLCNWGLETSRIIFDCIIPRSERWRRLVIRTPKDSVLSYLQNVPAPSLEAIELCYFSSEMTHRQPISSMINLASLSALSLQNVSVDGMLRIPPQLRKFELQGRMTWSAFCALCDVLDDSRGLEYLTLHFEPVDIYEHNEPQYIHRMPVSLPALRCCRIVTAEGLSTHVSRLVGQLRCPGLMSMVVQDRKTERETLMLFTKPSDTSSIPTDTLTQHPSKLYVRSSDPYLAWASLTPIPALTVLELNAPQWPTHDRLEGLFNGLPTLETLILRKFQASSALQDIGTGPAIAIPSLQALDIEIKHERSSEDYQISQFLSMFSLPRLQSLRLQNLRAEEWEDLLYCLYYPSLRSLVLQDMKDFISSTADPAMAFPLLTNLHLVKVHSNYFLRRLLKKSRTVPYGWPELQSLTIQGDNLISKPLLYKVVAFRSGVGLRISKLVLEERFVNEKLRAWLTCHSCVEYILL